MDKNRTGTGDISQLSVRNVRGELVPLKDVTQIVTKPTLLQISREDRQRAVTVFGNVAPGKSQADALAAAQKIALEVLPEGYHLAATGSSQQFQDTFHELIL